MAEEMRKELRKEDKVCKERMIMLSDPAPRQLRIAIGLNPCSGMRGKTVKAAKQP